MAGSSATGYSVTAGGPPGGNGGNTGQSGGGEGGIGPLVY